MIAEIGNAVWKRTARGETSLADAIMIIERAVGAFTRLISLQELAPQAMRLSVTLNHPIYDFFYLALAMRENAPLVTADRKLAIFADRIGVPLELLG